MQRPDQHKRRLITATAARLFAARPYHEVTLDAVAAAAKVGKGTLYVYFAGKEQLYAALIDDAFAELITGLKAQLDEKPLPARDALAAVVRGLLIHARRFPQLFRLMREGQQLPCAAQLQRHRAELTQLVLGIVRAGVRSGELRDAQPRLTAVYLPALVRAAVLYGPPALASEKIVDHILQVLSHGVAAATTPPPARRADPTARRPRPSRS